MTAPQGPTVFGGRYELHRRIARGGMAEVYLARDLLLDRSVAVKVLFAEFATDPTFVERFRREAKAAAGLSHPNIVGIYDWGEENGTYYIVMEYIEGRSLAQTLSNRGRLDPMRAADIASEVAAALGAAHKAGVAHRDVKPGNVLISNSGEVKVADFGIATAMVSGAENNLTQTGSVMGTATYFSPEQAQGKPVDPRSDLYSLGVVLYEMLVGAPPFTGDTPVAIAYKHVQEAPQSPKERGVDVPVPLAAITMKLLAKNPENRYPTAEDLRSDISRYRSGAQLTPEVGGPITGATPVLPSDTPPGYVAPTQMQPGAAPPGAVPPGTQVMPAMGAQGQAGMGTQMMPQPGYGPPPGYAEPPRRGGGGRAGLGGVAFLLLLLGLVGLVVALLLYFNDRNSSSNSDDQDTAVTTVSVTSVRGLTQGEAERQIENLGLNPVIEFANSDTVDPGVVISQDPRPATAVEQGEDVTIVVSSGVAPISVPDVVGIQSSDAQIELDAAGFTIEVQEIETDDALEGQVVSQEPPGGEDRPPGSTVVIQVSTGPLSKEIPPVVGLSADEARDILEEAGFVVELESKTSVDVERGLVIATVPDVGVKLKPEETVQVQVSEGPPLVDVPNVLALFQADAVNELQTSGFLVQVLPQDTLNPAEVDVVLAMSPQAGDSVEQGSIVQIFIGQLLPPTATPIPPTAVPTAIPTPTPVPLPTATPIPPTPVPATATPVPAPPTSTPEPAPPTATPAPAPPTATPPPPPTSTPMPAPPTATPTT